MDDFLVRLQNAKSAEEIEAIYHMNGKEISWQDAQGIFLIIKEMELKQLPFEDQSAIASGALFTKKLKEFLENIDLL